MWAKVPDLVFGGLGKLRIDAPVCETHAAHRAIYGDLIQFLAQTHKVVPFAYDWRLPVEQEATGWRRNCAASSSKPERRNNRFACWPIRWADWSLAP